MPSTSQRRRSLLTRVNTASGNAPTSSSSFQSSVNSSSATVASILNAHPVPSNSSISPSGPSSATSAAPGSSIASAAFFARLAASGTGPRPFVFGSGLVPEPRLASFPVPTAIVPAVSTPASSQQQQQQQSRQDSRSRELVQVQPVPGYSFAQVVSLGLNLQPNSLDSRDPRSPSPLPISSAAPGGPSASTIFGSSSSTPARPHWSIYSELFEEDSASRNLDSRSAQPSVLDLLGESGLGRLRHVEVRRRIVPSALHSVGSSGLSTHTSNAGVESASSPGFASSTRGEERKVDDLEEPPLAAVERALADRSVPAASTRPGVARQSSVQAQATATQQSHIMSPVGFEEELELDSMDLDASSLQSSSMSSPASASTALVTAAGRRREDAFAHVQPEFMRAEGDEEEDEEEWWCGYEESGEMGAAGEYPGGLARFDGSGTDCDGATHRHGTGPKPGSCSAKGGVAAASKRRRDITDRALAKSAVSGRGGFPRKQRGIPGTPGHVRNATLGALYPGSKFTGVQRSGRNTYDVCVDIKYVDLHNATLCGYLNIRGLTEDFPELTTFFEAEVIGPRFPFLTRKWDADEHIDRQHWGKFPAFKPYERTFNDDSLATPDTALRSGHVFMRWKEHFLVPDHRVTTISGASFAGFYYICYDINVGEITGYYFHLNSEWFQSLSLRHKRNPAFPHFEFR